MNPANPVPQTPFNFPCDYSVKVFGKTNDALRDTACAIIERHSEPINPAQIRAKHSRNNTYLSLTIRITATSRAQLDAMNTELQSCDLVLYVL